MAASAVATLVRFGHGFGCDLGGCGVKARCCLFLDGIALCLLLLFALSGTAFVKLILQQYDTNKQRILNVLVTVRPSRPPSSPCQKQPKALYWPHKTP